MLLVIGAAFLFFLSLLVTFSFIPPFYFPLSVILYCVFFWLNERISAISLFGSGFFLNNFCCFVFFFFVFINYISLCKLHTRKEISSDLLWKKSKDWVWFLKWSCSCEWFALFDQLRKRKTNNSVLWCTLCVMIIGVAAAVTAIKNQQNMQINVCSCRG